MWFRNLLRFWTQTKRSKTLKQSRWHRASLHLEPLEDRTVPATFTVTDLGDTLFVNSGNGLTLREALYYANHTSGADTIDFDSSLNGTIRLYYGQLYITEDVDIINVDGSGDITIDARQESRIFYVNSSSYYSSGPINVSISGLTLINGYNSGGGGGIAFYGDTLTLNDVVMRDNQNNAIGFRGADLVGTDVVFTGNYTSENGGAIDFGGHYLHLTNATFDNNSAGESGGAIFFDGYYLNIDGGSFIDSDASLNGGAIRFRGDYLSLSNLTFTNSNADNQYGGAIDILHVGPYAGANHITNCFFYNSSAGSDGGAIHFDGVNLYLDNVGFHDSSADGDGGAIFFRGNNLTSINGFTSDISNASGNGGGIYFYGNNLAVGPGSFNDNNATGDGGAIFFTGNSLNLDGVDFTNNDADGDGGAIKFTGKYLDFTNLTFDTNTAGGIGGAVDIYYAGTTGGSHAISYTYFYHNTADGDGGAIYFHGHDFSLDHVKFYDSTSGGAGGAVYFFGNDLTVDTAQFSKSDADGDGGAVYFSGHDLSLKNVRFYDSTSNGTGGAVYFSGNDLTLDTVQSYKSVADNNGGGIFFSGHNLTGNDVTIYNGDAGGDGGGIYFYGNQLKLDRAYFYNNNADGDGGGIDFNGKFFDLDVVHFSYNDAGGVGGGVSLFYGSAFQGIWDLTNATFDHNTADGNGGAIYGSISGDLLGTLNFDTLDFNNDTSHSSGGGVYLDVQGRVRQNSTLNLAHLTFDHEYADTDGGALVMRVSNDIQESITVNGLRATYCTATGGVGGGAYFYFAGKVSSASGITFTDLYFGNCTANTDAGGVGFHFGQDVSDFITIDGLVANYNLAQTGDGGGALFYLDGILASDSGLTFKDFSFDHNISDGGKGAGLLLHISGDIYDDIAFDHAVFTYNDANDSGGGISLYLGGLMGTGSSVSITNASYFGHNSADGGKGGGLEFVLQGGLYDTIVIDDTDFKYNNSLNGGGGASFYFNVSFGDFQTIAELQMSNCVFYYNTTSGNGGGVEIISPNNFEGVLTIPVTTSFIHNVANQDGGGLQFYLATDFVAVNTFNVEAHFERNAATNGGGINIYIAGNVDEYLGIPDAILSYNAATADGGGVRVYVAGDVTANSTVAVLGTHFDHNTASNDGGGMALQIAGNMVGTLKADSATFLYNESYYGNGGGLYVYVGGDIKSSGQVLFIDSTLSHNTANVNGGGLAVYVAGDLAYNIILDNTDFSYNRAVTEDGGGDHIYIAGDVTTSGVVKVVDSTFDHNIAGDNGGGLGIYVAGDFNNDFLFVNTDFTYNQAQRHGGGFYSYFVGDMADTGLFYIGYGDFSHNTAKAGDGGGGAFKIGGNLYADTTITHVTINHNVADKNGGGLDLNVLYNIGGRFILDNLTVTYNDAKFAAGGGLHINAGYYLNSDFHLQNSTFDHNTAKTNGGGAFINVDGSTTGNFYLTNLVVTNNTAGRDGGGLSVELGNDSADSFSGNFLISDVTVTGNKATAGDGGGFAIYIGYELDTAFSMSNGIFTSNTSGRNGGGLFLHIYYDVNVGGSIAIDSSSFTSNKANNNGGGAMIHVGDDLHGALTVLDTPFKNNTATLGDGGGIDIYLDESLYSTGKITLASTTSSYLSITSNTAGGDGGGVSVKLGYNAVNDYFLDGPITFSYLDINNNKAGDDGGGLHIGIPNYLPDAGYLIITYDKFTSNQAKGEGGGFNFFVGDYIAENATFLMHDVTFTSNKATDNGGGMAIHVGGNLYGDFVPYNVDILYNQSTGKKGDGGGVYFLVDGDIADTALITFTDFLIKGNTAKNNGGGLALKVNGAFYGDFNLDLSTVSTNTATGNGGGIDVDINGSGGVGGFRLYNSTVDTNTAGGDGGGLHFTDEGTATLTLFDSTISGNTAASEGGGVWFATVSGYLDIINSTIYGNKATNGSGGGILIDNAPHYYAHIYNTTIAGNTAPKGTGGGVYAGVDIILKSDLIGNNTAKLGRDIGGAGNFYTFYSLIETTALANIVTVGSTNIYNQDPELLPLGFHGGPTKTLALQPTSPAINIGSNPTNLKFDQRGKPHRREIPANAGVDAGSFEFDPQTTPAFFAVGAGAGGGPAVSVYNPDKSLRFSFFAFAPGFRGGVNVAMGDVNGDGVADIICGAGPGGGPAVGVFSGKDGTEIASFFAFVEGFRGGVYVAAGDLNGDGFSEIIVGAGAGGGPAVSIFDGQTLDFVNAFFAFNVEFGGGVRVAAGDINGDGTPDIICGAGPGGGPRVQVFNGLDQSKVLANFFAFPSGFRGGVYVGAGDLNGDGFLDIIVGAGPGGGPAVQIYDGFTRTQTFAFYAYTVGFTGGVRVGAVDSDQDGIAEIITGAGPGGGPNVKLFDNLGVETDSFFAFTPGFVGGIFVS